MKFETDLKVTDLAELVNAEIIGESNSTVTGVGDVRRATVGDITFAENDKFLQLALLSPASVVIVAKRLNLPPLLPEGKMLLRVEHAQDALNTIASEMFSHLRPTSTIEIHPTAVVASSATIGKDCAIGPYCIVGNNVSIGRGTRLSAQVIIEDDCNIGEVCEIGSLTVINRRCILGDRVTIQGGCHIGAEPCYYYKIENELRHRQSFGSVELAADVVVGAGCTIDRGVSGNTFIDVGSKLDNQIHIGHDVYIGKRVRVAAHTTLAGYVQIGDDVIVRGNVAIMQYVKVGKGAEILGKSGVDLDVAENETVFGIPATTRDRYAQRRRVLRKRIRRLEKEAEPPSGIPRDVQVRVFQTIADEAGKDISEISSSQNLVRDLKFDSLDLIELQIALQEEFDMDVVELQLSEDAFENVQTVGDVVELVKKSLNPR